jgi:hypothetical protein
VISLRVFLLTQTLKEKKREEIKQDLHKLNGCISYIEKRNKEMNKQDVISG